MRPKRSEREFSGVEPKNKAIIDKVRRDGYIGVMFNKEDFMDAVVWSANVVYDYKDYYVSHRERIVVPVDDLPFWKPDIVNAHILMIHYYKMRENLVLVEELVQSLRTVAKFQPVKPEDMELMKRWDEYTTLVQRKMDHGDFSDLDIGDLKGTETTYERYRAMVDAEISNLMAQVAKI
jgi:hypothetical protein